MKELFFPMILQKEVFPHPGSETIKVFWNTPLHIISGSTLSAQPYICLAIRIFKLQIFFILADWILGIINKAVLFAENPRKGKNRDNHQQDNGIGDTADINTAEYPNGKNHCYGKQFHRHIDNPIFKSMTENPNIKSIQQSCG